MKHGNKTTEKYGNGITEKYDDKITRDAHDGGIRDGENQRRERTSGHDAIKLTKADDGKKKPRWKPSRPRDRD